MQHAWLMGSRGGCEVLQGVNQCVAHRAHVQGQYDCWCCANSLCGGCQGLCSMSWPCSTENLLATCVGVIHSNTTHLLCFITICAANV
jgi:hypothetical protein